MRSSINGIDYAHSPIVEQCLGCAKVSPREQVCVAYLYPATRWKSGPCALATHVREQVDDKAKGKVRVGQQKQKKRKR